jgi:hypothetical protein
MKVVEKMKTHVLCSVTFSENHAVLEIMLKNMVELDRYTCFACWIIKATETHPEYVTLNAFPLQQWFCESA